jgi:hypothetical protein
VTEQAGAAFVRTISGRDGGSKGLVLNGLDLFSEVTPLCPEISLNRGEALGLPGVWGRWGRLASLKSKRRGRGIHRGDLVPGACSVPVIGRTATSEAAVCCIPGQDIGGRRWTVLSRPRSSCKVVDELLPWRQAGAHGSQLHVVNITAISYTGGRITLNGVNPSQRTAATPSCGPPRRSSCSKAARCVGRALSTSVRGRTSHRRPAEER